MTPLASRRLFRAASIGHLLVGIAHFNGQFLGRLMGKRLPAEEAEIMARMASIGGEMLGLRFSLLGVLDGLGLFYTAFALVLGLQNLMTLQMVPPGQPAPRNLAWLNAGLCAVLGAIAGLLGLAPPLLCYAILLPLFLLAARGKPVA
jgi:hypothetical protein